MRRAENMAPFDEVFKPCMSCLREIWVCFVIGDEGCGTEEDGAVTDLFFG